MDKNNNQEPINSLIPTMDEFVAGIADAEEKGRAEDALSSIVDDLNKKESATPVAPVTPVTPVVEPAKPVESTPQAPVVAPTRDEFEKTIGDKIASLKTELSQTFQETLTKNQEESAKQTKEIIESLVKGKTETPYLVDIPWVKENRQPNGWDEVAQWAALESMARMEKQFGNGSDMVTKMVESIYDGVAKKFEEKEKATVAEQQKSEQEEQVKINQMNKQWDDELDRMVKSNLIPAPSQQALDIRTKLYGLREDYIKREGSMGAEEKKGLEAQMDKLITDLMTDPHMKARTDLFQALRENNLRSLEQAYLYHYKPTSKQPAGADAPVSGGGTHVPANNSEDFTYDEIHNTSFEDLIMQKYK